MDKPRRAWLQIHLSTAIILMICASMIVGANCLPTSMLGSPTYGLPLPFLCPQKPVVQVPNSGQYTVIVWRHTSYLKVGPLTLYFSDNGWNYGALALNVFASVVCLSIVGIVFEWRIRRREAIRAQIHA